MLSFRQYVKESHTPEQVKAAEKKYSVEYDKHKRGADRNKANKERIAPLFRTGMSKRERSEVQYHYDIFKNAQNKQDHKAKLRKRALDIIHRPKAKKEPQPEPMKQPEPQQPEPKSRTQEEPPKKKGILSRIFGR